MTWKFWSNDAGTPAAPRGLAMKLTLLPPSMKRYSVLADQLRDTLVSMPPPAVQLARVAEARVDPWVVRSPPNSSRTCTNAPPAVRYSNDGQIGRAHV